MPHYYFEIWDADGIHSDADGLELDDLHAACAEARRTLPGLACGVMKDDAERRLSIIVKDGDGRPLYKATLMMSGEASGASLPVARRR